MGSLRSLLVLLLTLVFAGARAAEPPLLPYWTDAWRGWHFYELPAEDLEMPRPARKAASPTPSVQATRRAPELVRFEQLQKSLEERRQIAIMQPTEANVRRYMALEAEVVAQASRFADVAQRVAWSSPELDPTMQGRPVNAKAVEVFDKEQAASRSRSMHDLASTHALIFVFRSDCPYCHAFAPTLDAFRRRHGLQVLAVSLDGGTLSSFPDARRDNGIATNLRVTQVPAVFLAQPGTGLITPIGFGVMSQAQLLERIATVASSPIDAGAIAIGASTLTSRETTR
jgi:conjugal transfer pilus assembly protein TraF